jgi:hypothetical protein
MANVSMDLGAPTATRTAVIVEVPVTATRVTNSGVPAGGGTTAHPITS